MLTALVLVFICAWLRLLEALNDSFSGGRKKPKNSKKKRQMKGWWRNQTHALASYVCRPPITQCTSIPVYRTLTKRSEDDMTWKEVWRSYVGIALEGKGPTNQTFISRNRSDVGIYAKRSGTHETKKTKKKTQKKPTAREGPRQLPPLPRCAHCYIREQIPEEPVFCMAEQNNLCPNSSGLCHDFSTLYLYK